MMETDSPNHSGSRAASTTGVRASQLGEMASLRDESHMADDSRTKARLREDLTRLKNDLDALMSHASTLTETELREARDRIFTQFSSMRYMAYGMVAQAGKQFAHGKNMTLDYVRNKPLQSIAIATGAGLLLGMLLRRD
ncbi:MAG: glycine zipper domain-containing protein [Oxalobacteraceae bacterium]|jgi:ElaB/YqjD/DUF883 family membrane-anchored ribosome-binding protein